MARFRLMNGCCDFLRPGMHLFNNTANYKLNS